MAASYHIDPRIALGVIRLSDRVMGTDLVEAVKAFYSDAAWSPGYSVLWDARSISRLVLAPEDADAVTDTICAMRERIGPARVAVVTAGFEVYASGLLIAIRSRKSSGREVEMFPDLATALDWLAIGDLPPAVDDFLQG